MSLADLVFGQAPLASPAELVFGQSWGTPDDADLVLAATLPGPVLAATVGTVTEANLDAVLPGVGLVATVGPPVMIGASIVFPVTLTASALYRSDTDRPVVATQISMWQEGAAQAFGVDVLHGQANAMPAGMDARHSAATWASSRTDVRHQRLLGTRTRYSARHQNAARLPAVGLRHRTRDLARSARLHLSAEHQEAVAQHVELWTSWQDRWRDRRPALAMAWSSATMRRAQLLQGVRSASAVQVGRRGRYQEAMRPPAGRSRQHLVTPPDLRCYLPDGDLVFSVPSGASAALLFICDGSSPNGPAATVTVPIRRAYIVLNTVTLRAVGADVLLPLLGLSLNIDADSWTYSWSATLPGAELGHVQPTDGEPVELEASINGTAYRLIVESIGSDRIFGKQRIRIGGRGKNARLGEPYVLQRSFGNSEALTAQQLMADALSESGVPLGWDLEFDLDDWSVPAGAWSHRGSHISAVAAIADAAGGYVQPHRTADTLRILHRYPHAPWDWAALVPDIELPAAPVVQEGVQWADLPRFNRVFIAGGVSGGIMGQVTRTGTAGDAVAPMVVDALITAPVAARQRGRAVLSAVGRQAAVTLSLPVLPETGVIEPGRLVRYVDGSTSRVGLTRTLSVVSDVRTARQTIGVETYVDPS